MQVHTSSWAWLWSECPKANGGDTAPARRTLHSFLLFHDYTGDVVQLSAEPTFHFALPHFRAVFHNLYAFL